MVFVQPSTVIAWQRRRFRDHWARLSQARPGRPRLAKAVQDLIREMSSANARWGSPRIVGELAKLGIHVAKATVERYMVRPKKPPSPTWRAFLDNHVKDLVSVDFFVVPTVTFKVLFVFIVLAHARRRIVHFNVTEHPTAQWTAHQVSEAFPWEAAPRYLVRYRDRVYGLAFKKRVECMGIEEVLTAPRSPWQNPFAERVIGSVRRECLDQVVVISARHLLRLLGDYFEHYHRWRCHRSPWIARSLGPCKDQSTGKSWRSRKPAASTGTTSGAPPPERQSGGGGAVLRSNPLTATAHWKVLPKRLSRWAPALRLRCTRHLGLSSRSLLDVAMKFSGRTTSHGTLT